MPDVPKYRLTVSQENGLGLITSYHSHDGYAGPSRALTWAEATAAWRRATGLVSGVGGLTYTVVQVSS